MKRYGFLWAEITAFENLLTAARKAEKGKRFRENVLTFNYNLEQELEKLQLELQTKTYRPGKYKTFRVMEPKPRMISAAPYRDRVVHHALCNIVMPIFEKTFISDCYANRTGFGTHRALKKFIQFTRSYQYILQCDIRKYFPSVDHEILKSIIYRKIKCPDTLWLINLLIDSSNPQELVLEHFPGDDLLTPTQHRRGLPIGNLTSQCFANIYLNGLDHFVKEQLRANCYLRYVDDFALFSNDREFLVEARQAIEEYLTTLRLKIHPIKSQLFETKRGANFVGFRVLPIGQTFPKEVYIRIRPENLKRGRCRLKRYQKQYAIGQLTFNRLSQSLQSWAAHLKHADTYHLRHQIFSSLHFSPPSAPLR